jgi:ferric-dicitrate binding protein FerR (iron transport regulator)
MKSKNTSYDQSSDDRYEVFFDFVDKKIRELNVPAKTTKEEAWEKLVRSVENRQTKIISHRFILRFTAAAASVLLFIAALFYYIQSRPIDVICGTTEMKTIFLPDSSKVYMNAASRISYHPGNWDTERNLELDGEACFEVKSGKKFTVKTVNGTITVLGTSFNVFSREGEFKVFCLSGKVAVENENRVILRKGQWCSNTGINQLKGPVPGNDLKPVSWINGEYWFTDTPLRKVFDEIERQFGVEIICNDCLGRNYTGYFNRKSLREALINVCEPMSLSWDTSGGKITITETPSSPV